jgi:hypothetical protein
MARRKKAGGHSEHPEVREPLRRQRADGSRPDPEQIGCLRYRKVDAVPHHDDPPLDGRQLPEGMNQIDVVDRCLDSRPRPRRRTTCGHSPRMSRPRVSSLPTLRIRQRRAERYSRTGCRPGLRPRRPIPDGIGAVSARPSSGGRGRLRSRSVSPRDLPRPRPGTESARQMDP